MTNRSDDWTAHLGDSSLPADEFTFTDGSNYGLDGFDFVTPANEGVEQAARLPEVRGLSGLPDGIVTGEAEDDDDIVFEEATEGGEGLYLDGVFEDGAVPVAVDDYTGTVLNRMLSEEEGALPLTREQKRVASLADLKWLDPTQEQDPDRLPKELLPDRPPLDSSPELEEAWGVDRRTDGISLIPDITDREVALYNESISEGPESGLPQPGGKTAKDVKDSILWAIRQSHYGTDLAEIKRGLIKQLGHDARRTVKAMEIIEQEHGLAGRVFIRASAFPGLKNGKWVKELKRVARTAHYVITDDKTIGKKLGMVVVSEVPWKQALGYYREWLGLAGYKVASKGNPKTILRNAFLRGPSEKTVEAAPKPVVKPVVASQEQASQEMRAPKAAPVRVTGSEEKAVDRKRRAALIQIAKWAKDGLITLDEAIQIKNAGGSPYVMITSAGRLMQARQATQVDYKGTGKDAAKAQEDRPTTGIPLSKRKADLLERDTAKLRKFLDRTVRAGLLTKGEVGRLLAIEKHPVEVMKIANAAIQAAADRRQEKLEPADKADYKGAGAVASIKGNQLRDPMANIVDNRAQELKKAAFNHINKLVREGHLVEAEAKKIRLAKNMSPAEMIAKANNIVMARHSAPKGDYEGQTIQAAPQTRVAKTLDAHTARLASLAKKTGFKASEIESVLNWSRRLMSEGVAGHEFDDTLRARFSQPLIKAASPLVKEARKAHEGLAGFLYVDASAYASPEGVKGCERGALKHRTNGLKFVLAMERCGSCTFTNADGYCQKYNKKLVDAPPVKDVQAYQRKSLELADAPDQEVTASLFNPSEFSLQSQLDGEMELGDSVASGTLGDILFGGTELE